MDLYSYSWADNTPRTCPGCSGRFPVWSYVYEDGLKVLTHDGDTICPRDPHFGGLTGPVPLEVAA
ncbi:hypothetical protein ACF06T_09050 [Streptomyces albidoflavus]